MKNYYDYTIVSNYDKTVFEKTVELAKKRNVSDDEFVENKSEIDAYFLRGNKNG